MKLHLIFGIMLALAGMLFAVGESCTDDYDCNYGEYCYYGTCESEYESDTDFSYSSSCCGGLILPLAAIGLLGYTRLK